MISESDKRTLHVGFRQTMRALNEGKAVKVFLAEDCEDKIKKPVESACEKRGCELVYAEDMKELGKWCGIEIKASCAAALSE